MFFFKRIVCLLLKRGADPESLDTEQSSPISIAIENCQPNIVTMSVYVKIFINSHSLMLFNFKFTRC